jgi:hypothetical protein
MQVKTAFLRCRAAVANRASQPPRFAKRAVALDMSGGGDILNLPPSANCFQRDANLSNCSLIDRVGLFVFQTFSIVFCLFADFTGADK